MNNTKTTKTLRLTFKDDNGKKTVLTLANAKPGLEENVVRDAMNKIAGSSVFIKDGVNIYASVQSAAYVDRTVSDIFDDSTDTAAK